MLRSRRAIRARRAFVEHHKLGKRLPWQTMYLFHIAKNSYIAPYELGVSAQCGHARILISHAPAHLFAEPIVAMPQICRCLRHPTVLNSLESPRHVLCKITTRCGTKLLLMIVMFVIGENSMSLANPSHHVVHGQRIREEEHPFWIQAFQSDLRSQQLADDHHA